MTLEAVKALFGQLPPYNPSVMTGATAQSPQEELVSNRMRIRAWSMVASQVLLLAVLCLLVCQSLALPSDGDEQDCSIMVMAMIPECGGRSCCLAAEVETSRGGILSFFVCLVMCCLLFRVQTAEIEGLMYRGSQI